MHPADATAVPSSPARHGTLAGEGGWLLVEALCSAMVLVIVVAAVLTSMDTAAISSGLSRARSTGATLAEQDQERLRSMRTVDLSNYSENRTVNLGGGPYSVTSVVRWLRDSNGEPLSCTNGSTQADYLLIGSTVSSGTMQGQSVHVESLLAPPVGSFGPTQGSFGVQVLDSAGAPVEDMDVTITGPDTAVLPTNELGCSIFGYIPPGSYTATVNHSGWVDAGGQTVVTKSGTVSGGNVNAVTVQYDEAASVGVTFDTVVGIGSPQPSTAKSITAANSGVPPSGARQFTASARAGSFNASNLFPFASAYAVYAGTCAAANPQTYDSNYFATAPGSVTTSPGWSYQTVVRVPAVNLLVTRGGLPFSAAHVVLTAIGTGCTEKITAYTNALGALFDPGMPFGVYSICVDDTLRSRTLAATVSNTSPGGTLPITVSIPTSGTTGSVCT
jgi:Tfp pilus assembly protein PilV